MIVATGTGATGWARSIHRERGSGLTMPSPTDDRLAFFVREAFPSNATSTEITEGIITAETELVIHSEFDEGGVVFSDGIEEDALSFDWGMRLRVGLSSRKLSLVREAA
jgi:hypothetical protein